MIFVWTLADVLGLAAPPDLGGVERVLWEIAVKRAAPPLAEQVAA